MRKTISCPTCRKKVSAEAAACPHCGEPGGAKFQEIAAKRMGCIPMIGIIIFGLVGLLFVVNDNGPLPMARLAEGARAVPSAKPRLEVLSYAWTRTEYGSSMIVGKVRNNTSREISYAQVEFKVKNKAGDVIENAWANCAHLGAGETWKFEALVTKDEPKMTCELVEASGY